MKSGPAYARPIHRAGIYSGCKDTSIMNGSDTLITDPRVLNSMKEKLSVAYLYGLNAALDYAIQETHKDLDGMGIDFIVCDKLIGPGRTVASEANTINLQLKGVSVDSASMIRETADEIQYRLKDELNPIGAHFLVVVVLPREDELERWCQVTAEELTLRKCAYYLHIPTKLKAGFIKIPKRNILNLETFPTLFDAAKLGKQK